MHLRVCSSWAGIRFYFDERSEIETSSGKEYLKFGAVICLDRGKWKMEWMYDHLGKRVNCHTNVTLEVDELEPDTV
jgi:hypothetical protein